VPDHCFRYKTALYVCKNSWGRQFLGFSMVETLPSRPWVQRLQRYRAWLILGLTIAVILGIRLRLRDMPLERDEGEYAYAGQLILQGVAPYKEAYNMKLPGTYFMYALIMAVFGQTPSGIHIGLALINTASIILIFLLGRRLLDTTAGLVAAVVFGLVSASPSVLGLAAHATHFVVLPALAGMLLLLETNVSSLKSKVSKEGGEWRETDDGSRPESNVQPSTLNLQLFVAGLLFGLSFIMKQQGVFFGLFGLLYLAFRRLHEPTELKVIDARRAKAPPIAWVAMVKELMVFAGGLALPYVLVCLLLWWAGAFQKFVFWTITYAREYATATPLVNAAYHLRAAFNVTIVPNIFLSLLSAAGLIMIWRDGRPRQRFFLLTLLVCSAASTSVGFYWRPHYFITLLPAVALLAGVAISRAQRLLKHNRMTELFPGRAIFGLLQLIIFHHVLLINRTSNAPTSTLCINCT